MSVTVLNLSNRTLVLREGEGGESAHLLFDAKLTPVEHIDLKVPKSLKRGHLTVSSRSRSRKKVKDTLEWHGDWSSLDERFLLDSTFSVALNLPSKKFDWLVAESRTSVVTVALEVLTLESMVDYTDATDEDNKGTVAWNVEQNPKLPVDGFSIRCDPKRR